MTLENVVGLLGIDHILSRRPVNLSGGERRASPSVGRFSPSPACC